MKKPNQDDEPFFITEEIAAEMIAGGYEFELPPIPCTIRLRDVLERMTDAELALQPGEIADQERERRVQPHDLVMVFFMALSLIVLANCCH
nr:hypothetical protein [Escherichia coli]